MTIRFILLFALGAIGYLGFVRRNRLPIHIFLVFAVLGAAGVAVLVPDWANALAHLVGVGRGADLVGYLVQVCLLFVALHYYTKFVDLQRNFTEIVREVAILRTQLEKIASCVPVSEDTSQAVGSEPHFQGKDTAVSP